MKLLLQALLLTSVSVSITAAGGPTIYGDEPSTPRNQSTGGFIPTAPIKQEKEPDQNSNEPEVSRNLLAEFDAVADAADESDNESNAASDSAFDPSAVSSEDEYEYIPSEDEYTPSDVESDA